MMKKISILTVLVAISGLFAVLGNGCCPKPMPGETAAEVHRRHERINDIRKQQLRSDIDKFLLTDKPSELSDVRIP
jgi:hypothetical protein